MQFSLVLDDQPLLPRIRARLRASLGRSASAGAAIGQPARPQHARLQDQGRGLAARLKAAAPALPVLGRALRGDPTRHRPHHLAGNLAEPKAEQLPQALRMIVASTGRLDLAPLADLDEEAAMQWLRRLPGVGSKIAAAS